MSRIFLSLAVVIAVSACQQIVPQNGPGFALLRPPPFEVIEAPLETASIIPETPVISTETAAVDPVKPVAVAEIKPEKPIVETVSKPVEVASATSADEPLSATEFLSASNTSISDEQDFGAVSERETIQSDAERLKAQREAYTEIKPTDLPTRPESVNVAEYALSANNPIGNRKYTRLNPFAKMQHAKNCGRYLNQDDAQAHFLEAGGPRRDVYSLDPDGDGYACSWTPETYRKLLSSR